MTDELSTAPVGTITKAEYDRQREAAEPVHVVSSERFRWSDE